MKLKTLTMFLMAALITGSTTFAQEAKKPAAPAKKAAPATPKPAPLTIKESDNGKTFNVTAGSSFTVLFAKECIGCRFSWEYKAEKSGVVSAPVSSYGKPSCTDCTGGNHDHLFKFTAKKAGKATLTFSLGDEKTFSVTVVVK